MTTEQKTLSISLQSLSKGERTALRREAGKSMAEANGIALAAFFRSAPSNLSRRQQECWFSVMTIACLWNLEEAASGGEFPVMLRRYANHEESNGLEKKLRSLLDTRWEEDGYLTAKICRLARMLRSDNRQLMPDADALLYDLLHWNSDSRFVQLRWAEHFYQANPEYELTEDEGDE